MSTNVLTWAIIRILTQKGKKSVKEMMLAGGFRSVSSKFDTLGVERVVMGKM